MNFLGLMMIGNIIKVALLGVLITVIGQKDFMDSGELAAIGAFIMVCSPVIGIVIAIMNKGGKSSSSSGERRSFACDKCGSKKWIVLDTSTYDGNVGYNYKEWLRCAKCGRETTNERTI
jgi:DNA-directed RNA polymerase subunit RPC12/RpoP